MVQEKPAGNKGLAAKPFFERYGFSSLRLGDIRLLCLVGFAEAFVWGMIITLLPVMASRLGIPPERIGWLFTAYFIVYIFIQWPSGKWSDRKGRKKPIILGISIYTLAVLLLSQGGNMVYLLLVLAIAGAGLGIYSPAVRAGIADLASEKVRGASLGVFFTTRMLGFFLGPNLSGIIADQWGIGFPFVIGALSLGAGIWASSALSPELSKTVRLAPVETDWPPAGGSRVERGNKKG